MAEKPIKPRPQPTPELTERQKAAGALAVALVNWWRTFPPEPEARPDKLRPGQPGGG